MEKFVERLNGNQKLVVVSIDFGRKRGFCGRFKDE
jgi:hypothetical protein